MKKIILLLALSSVFILGTGCAGIKKSIGKIAGAGTELAWEVLGTNGDDVAKELGKAQVEYAEAQKLAAEALGIKEEVYAILADADQLTTDVKGFDKDSTSKLKTASAGSAKANEAIKRAMADKPKLDADGKKLMAQANVKLVSATIKMVDNGAKTVGLCIGIKNLLKDGGTKEKVVAGFLILPATTMASYVMKDMKANNETVKALRQYSKDQGVEVPPDDEVESAFAGFDNIQTEGLPTEDDK
jgi:hypothetical protein